MRPTIPCLALLAFATAPLAAQAPADTLPLQVAIRQIDAFNRRDLDAFMALWADSASISVFPSGATMVEGKAAVRARFAALMKTSLPTVRVEPRIVQGAFVADQERWDGPPGARNSAVWMYEIRGGLIRKAWTVVMP